MIVGDSAGALKSRCEFTTRHPQPKRFKLRVTSRRCVGGHLSKF